MQPILTAFRIAHPAGIAVKQKHGIDAQAACVNHAANILCVAHSVERRDLHKHVGDPNQGFANQHLLCLERGHDSRRRGEPHRHRLELLRRHLQRLETQTVARMELYLLEHRNRGCNRYISEPDPAAIDLTVLFNFVNANLGGLDGLGVVVQFASFHTRYLLLDVEFVDKVRLRPVQIHRVCVKLAERADLVHCADHATFSGLVLNGVDHSGYVAQVYLCRRIVVRSPVPLALDQPNQPVLIEQFEYHIGIWPELANVLLGERKLLHRALDVTDSDVRVVRVDHRLLRGLLENIVGVRHQVLVDGRVLGNEYHHRVLKPSPCPASLLPEAGNCSRVADHDACVQTAYIYAQFQCVGAGDSHYLPVCEPPLNLSALLREIASAIRVHRIRQFGRYWPQEIAAVLEQQLRRKPGAHKRDRLHSRKHEVGHEPHRLPQRALAVAASSPVIRPARRSGIQHGGIPQYEVLPRAPLGAPSRVDELDRSPDKCFCVFPGVGDSRGTTHEGRTGTVVVADTV